MAELHDIRIKNMFVPDHLLQSENFVDSIGKNVNSECFNALQRDLNNVLDCNIDLMAKPVFGSSHKPVPESMHKQKTEHIIEIEPKLRHKLRSRPKPKCNSKKIKFTKQIAQSKKQDVCENPVSQTQHNILTNFDTQIIELLVTYFESKQLF